MLKNAIFSAFNVDNDSERFATVVSVDAVSCAQASISESDERIDALLLETGSNHIKQKINNDILHDEKIELRYQDIVNIDDKINELKSPLEELKLRTRVQSDILACAYMYLERGATSKNLVNYVWCDTTILLSELRYLGKQNLIYYQTFDKELIDAGGKDDNRTVLLTHQGKEKFEAMSRNTNIELLQPSKDWVPFASNKKVFLAHRFNEIQILGKVKERLTNEGFEWREGKVEDLGFITEDILKKIKDASFFIAILTPSKEFNDGKFSTSSWILMEIGVAIAYERKVLMLAEDCIEQEEYARKLQAECQYEVFNREKDLDDRIKISIDRVKQEWQNHNRKKT